MKNFPRTQQIQQLRISTRNLSGVPLRASEGYFSVVLMDIFLNFNGYGAGESEYDTDIGKALERADWSLRRISFARTRG